MLQRFLGKASDESDGQSRRPTTLEMSYPIIQPPFTLKFPEMTKIELKAYFQWFIEQIPGRIDELANAVRQTSGYEAWQADKTPASLDGLGEWLAEEVETRQRSAEELQEIKGRLAYPIEISDQELTNRTFSLAVDTAMYLSQAFLENYPFLRWKQEIGSKRNANYGQPVLVEFGFGPCNPVWLMVVLAYGLVDKTYSGKRLREVYNTWAEQVRLPR